jgi:hypothetical protein
MGARTHDRLGRWTGISLVPVAVYAVHQLRFVAAFGGRADQELAAQGHAYMQGLAPFLVLACALWFGSLLTRFARAWKSGHEETPARRGLLALWLVAAIGLICLYAAQEFLEGLFATGHPQGIAGVFGAGGLWAVPAAFVVGLVLALAIFAACRVVAAVARRRRRGRSSRPFRVPALRPRRVDARPSSPLARRAAGRAPPIVLHANLT